MLRQRRDSSAELVPALHAIADALRGGESLRSAIERTAGKDGSPLAPVATALAAGRPLVAALRDEAAVTRSAGASRDGVSADLTSALAVLAVHAEAGGDPLPAVRALAARIARRCAARAEARALTTQARLSGRTILLLTPAFLLLVGATDPSGVGSWFGDPRTRLSLGAGLVLQLLGMLWIGAIVGGVGASGGSWAQRVPFVRAVRALVAGKARPTIDGEVADAADTVAFALDAGLSASAALQAVAPYCADDFGESVQAAVADVRAPPHQALDREAQASKSTAARRFAEAFATSATLGVPLAPALRTLADDVRDRRSVELAEDVRRASVRVLVPLGVVILPAFVLACLVPLFLGGLEGIAG